MAFHTTDPQYVNPFGSTAEDARNMYARVEAAMARAKKRLAKIPRPGSYWEEPEIHGSGRQVNLRGARGKLADFTDADDENEVTGRYHRRDLRLPARPNKRTNELVVASVAVSALGVAIGALALGLWIWKRSKPQPATTKTQLGEDAFSGFDLLLGCES